MPNWIPGYEWTGLPGAPDVEDDPAPDSGSDGGTSPDSGSDGGTSTDLPATSYGTIDLWTEVDDAGGNDGTGQSIADNEAISFDEDGGIDLSQTLGLPDLPWTLVVAAVVVGAALWLLRPVLTMASGVTQ